LKLGEEQSVVFGAGGSARAAAFALARSGAEVFVWRAATCCPAKSSLVPWRRSYSTPRTCGHRNFDAILNTTPVGMHPSENASPLTVQELRCNLVMDLIYRRLKRTAEGLPVREDRHVSGFDMFLAQGLFAHESAEDANTCARNISKPETVAIPSYGKLQQFRFKRPINQVHHQIAPKLLRRERRSVFARMHSKGVVFKIASKFWTAVRVVNSFAANGTSELFRGSVAARADENLRAGSRQRKRSRAREPPHQTQALASTKLHPTFQCAQDADVVGITTVQRPVAAHSNRIHCSDFAGKRLAIFQILRSGLLGGIVTLNPRIPNSGIAPRKSFQFLNQERQIDPRRVCARHSRCVHQR